MNLEDIIDPEYGLQQDKWSSSKPKFGKDNQLTVLGWSGRTGCNKYYIVKCELCCKDTELFGDGVFKGMKSNLTKGAIPCGCGENVRWSGEQYGVKIKRKLQETAYTFMGLEDAIARKTTKVVIDCPAHGVWKSTTIRSVLAQGGTCPSCKYECISNNLRVEDQIVIDRCLETGNFDKETKFQRCFDIDRKGSFWSVSCPKCLQTVIANQSDITKGKIPCECSQMAQRQAYISVVYDGTIPLALKFGIAVNSVDRNYRQNLTSSLGIRLHSYFLFDTKQQCLDAERLCKSTLKRSVISKQDFPDGYTETTYLYNLDKILEIYKNFGGNLIFKSEDITQ